MLKQELRLNYTLLREELTREQLSVASIIIANRLLELPIWQHSYFHIFLQIPEKKEIDTSYILSVLQGKDKNIVVPKVSGTSSLINYLLTDNTRLKKNRWNIPEPVDGIEVPLNKLEVVFVPLLAFDLKGNRVGYGKGFYDSFLGACPPNVIIIGLSIFEAVDEIEDVTENDIPLHYCITPKKTYEF